MWYEKSRRRVLLDFHFPDWDERILSKFDAKQAVENLVKGNVDCGIFYSKDHYGNSYYNTKIGHKHKNIGDRDFVGEFVEEARKAGLWVLIYYSIVWERWITEHHPEWIMRDKDGKPIPFVWGYACYNSGYKDYVIGQVTEIINQYDINGFHFDMMIYDFGGKACYCDNCRRLFKEKYGYDMPEEPTWDQKWRDHLEFRYESNYKFGMDLRNAIKKLNPDLSVIYNYHGAPGFTWKTAQRPVQHILYNDYGTGEAYTSAFGFAYTSLYPRFLRGLVDDRPYEVVTSRFNRSWDYTTEPVAHLKWEVLTYLSNGAASYIVDQPGYDGLVDPVVYERIGEIYGEVKEKQEYFGYPPIKQVGLYYSVKSRDWYGRDDMESYLLPFNGAFKALLESQIPVDILFDENINLKKLMKYPLFFLANVPILSETEIEMIVDYVKNGGILVATDETSLYDGFGNIMKDFALADLFGVHYKGKTQFRYNYFRLSESPYSEGINPLYDVLLLGPGNVVETQAQTYGELKLSFFDRQPDRFLSHNMHPVFETVGPAIIENKFGDGKVIYIPGKLAASYAGRYFVGEHRQLIRNIVYNNLPKAPLEVEAPLNVESVITFDERNNRYIVHLLGFQATKQATSGSIKPALMMEEPLLFRAKIRLNVPFSKVTSYKDRPELDIKGNIVELLAEDVHNMIIVEL